MSTYDPSGPYDPSGYEAYPPRRRPSAALAIAALVLGMLGVLGSWFVLGAVLGVLAIILGAVALAKIGRGTASGRGMAITGIVLGVISIAVAAFVFWIGVSIFNSPQVQNFQQCIEQAGNDQVAIERCAQQFQPVPAEPED